MGSPLQYVTSPYPHRHTAFDIPPALALRAAHQRACWAPGSTMTEPRRERPVAVEKRAAVPIVPPTASPALAYAWPGIADIGPQETIGPPGVISPRVILLHGAVKISKVLFFGRGARRRRCAVGAAGLAISSTRHLPYEKGAVSKQKGSLTAGRVSPPPRQQTHQTTSIPSSSWCRDTKTRNHICAATVINPTDTPGNLTITCGLSMETPVWPLTPTIIMSTKLSDEAQIHS